MALTNEQLADAVISDALQKRFRGQALKLAGYIKNGDNSNLGANLRAKRLLWANRIIEAADGAQHLVDSSARLLRWACATSSVFNTVETISEITDLQIESMVGAIMENEATFGAL